MSAFEPKLLSQKDFDTFCQEAVDEGQSLDEAASDTQEMFLESGFDLSRVWVCGSQQAAEQREVARRNVQQVQRSAGQGSSSSDCDSYLNASFSLAKLRQICKSKGAGEGEGEMSPEDEGIWRYFRAQDFLTTLVRLLAQEEECESEDDEESEEDATADYVDKLRLILEVMVLLASTLAARGPSLFPHEAEHVQSEFSGFGLRLSQEVATALVKSMLPAAAPALVRERVSSTPALLPPAVLANYLQVLRLLAADPVTRQHLAEEEARSSIEHFSDTAGFPELLESLKN